MQEDGTISVSLLAFCHDLSERFGSMEFNPRVRIDEKAIGICSANPLCENDVLVATFEDGIVEVGNSGDSLSVHMYGNAPGETFSALDIHVKCERKQFKEAVVASSGYSELLQAITKIDEIKRQSVY